MDNRYFTVSARFRLGFQKPVIIALSPIYTLRMKRLLQQKKCGTDDLESRLESAPQCERFLVRNSISINPSARTVTDFTLSLPPL